MVKTDFIYFRFRSREVKAYVQYFSDHCLVNISDEEILNDFTGQFRFSLPGKKPIEPYQRNKETKDMETLLRAIAAQLR